MKKLIVVLLVLLPFFGNSQTDTIHKPFIVTGSYIVFKYIPDTQKVIIHQAWKNREGAPITIHKGYLIDPCKECKYILTNVNFIPIDTSVWFVFDYNKYKW